MVAVLYPINLGYKQQSNQGYHYTVILDTNECAKKVPAGQTGCAINCDDVIVYVIGTLCTASLGIQLLAFHGQGAMS